MTKIILTNKMVDRLALITANNIDSALPRATKVYAIPRGGIPAALAVIRYSGGLYLTDDQIESAKVQYAAGERMSHIARALGVTVGDKVVLIAPQGQVTPAGIRDRVHSIDGKIFAIPHGLVILPTHEPRKRRWWQLA